MTKINIYLNISLPYLCVVEVSTTFRPRHASSMSTDSYVQAVKISQTRNIGYINHEADIAYDDRSKCYGNVRCGETMNVKRPPNALITSTKVAVKKFRSDKEYANELRWTLALRKEQRPQYFTTLLAVDPAAKVIVSEWEHGDTLGHLLSYGPKMVLDLPIGTRLAWVRDLASAMEIFHGLPEKPIHTDLHADNLVFTKFPLICHWDVDRARLKVIDFGYAYPSQLESPHQRSKGQVAAPEHAAKRWTQQYDMYAFGHHVFSLFAGFYLDTYDRYYGPEKLEWKDMMTELHLGKEPYYPTWNQFRNNCPTPSLYWLTRKCLSGSPGDRPASFKEVRELLMDN